MFLPIVESSLYDQHAQAFIVAKTGYVNSAWNVYGRVKDSLPGRGILLPTRESHHRFQNEILRRLYCKYQRWIDLCLS